jgi:hypothetical protein
MIMKPTSVFLTSMALLSQGAFAQVDPMSAPSAAAAPPFDQVQPVGPPGNGVYAITAAGPHQRRWAKLS